MGHKCGLFKDLFQGLYKAPFVFFIGLVILVHGSSYAAAKKNDDIAALIKASKIAPPPIHPKRRQQKTNAHRADQSRETLVAKSTAMLPPLPSRNPLHEFTGRTTSARHANTSLQILPLPTRGALIADTTKALAPLLNYRVSKRDIKLLKQSITAVLRGRHSNARDAEDALSNSAARKLAKWYYLRKSSDLSDPMRIERFRTQNKDWPSRSLLRRRTEHGLLKTNAEPKVVKALYGNNLPTTGVGKYLLARAYKRSGQPRKALKLARKAWHHHALGKKTERQLLGEFGDRLTNADHLRRADHFLYKDKKRHLKTVRRVRKYLTKAQQKKINLRMEVIKRRLRDAGKQYNKLGSAALSDVGLLFSKIQLLRREEKYDQSRKLLSQAPTDAKGMVEPDEWWIERRLQTRYALRHHKPLEAYKIASRHGRISRRNLADAEFLAGWLALTHLNKIKLAAHHFGKQRRAATRRREIAKAEYWLGRLKLKQKDTIGAMSHFASAAKYFHTYYGQLALQAVEKRGRLKKTPTPRPTRRDLKRFLARDAVRALIIAHKAKLSSLPPLFFNHLAWRLKSPGEMTLLAELASQIHSRRGSVVTGKIGVYRGFKLDRYAYPVNAMPHFRHLTPNVDTALVLALARQESEFNAKAKSPVGARGMMQIMPGTARQIARQHKVRYSRSRLTSDPSYNVTLGVAHLHDLIEQYNGSYILTLIAYNAGPRRVREWIEAFGDPRDPNIDTIDWIEKIPFTETRRYVQRIMSSIQIFRSRLSAGKSRISLVKDINRGHPDNI